MPELAAALGDARRIEKIAFSCCREQACLDAFKATGARDIIVCGMETHVCVYQTVLDLLAQDLRPFGAADAVCSRAKLGWRTALEGMRAAGATVCTTEMILFQLLVRAGTEKFKQVSKLVK